MTDGLSTKERILNAALDLFSEKGYDGVGVDLIASAAGIKGPSLYKHYKGKEDILNALTETVGEHYNRNFGTEKNPGKIPDSLEEFVQLSLGRFQFTLHDPMIKKVRRILAMEQFRNPRIAELATAHNIDGVQGMFAGILAGMMEKGLLQQKDPRQTAMEFIAPVSLLIQMADRQPEREEEALQRVEAHLRHFVAVYGA